MAVKEQSVKQNQPIFVGIDDGHSDVKVVLPDGSTQKFPTRIADGACAADFPGMETNTTVYTVYSETGKNKSSYTTHAYLQEKECVDIRFDNYPKSDYNLVMVQNALINSGLAGKNVIICTGLPVSSHYINGSINTDLVEAKKVNLQRKVEAVGNVSMANIEKSYVATEALAAYMDAIMDMNGKKSDLYSQLAKEVVAVLDIGGKTTDFAVLYEGGKVLDQKRLGSVSLGILNLKDDISNHIKQKLNLNSVSLKHIDNALQSGSFKYAGNVYDVSKDIVDLKDNFIDKVLSTLDRELGDLGDVDSILCVGGGAALLEENLKKKYKNQAIFMPDPEFANARGMYKIAAYVMKGK
jgi:plasmid segregation protein ParM